jgi:hypothetical protein
VRGKEGRDIPHQTRMVGFGISAGKSFVMKTPISRLSRSVCHAFKILSLGPKSLANAAGTADPKTHRLAAAREEHCLDNRHALHATGTPRHS